MNLLPRIFSITAVCVILAGVVAGGTAAQEPGLGGYSIGGTAATTAWSYDQPSAGVPAKPTMEVNGVYTEAILGSGPNGYGLASLAWPGQVSANVGGFIWATFWTEATNGGWPPEYQPDVPPPNYPVRAETFYPQGPEEQRAEPVAGSRMASSARRERTHALATADASGFEDFVTVGTQTSRSTSELVDGRAIATARATASEIVLFDGLIRIDSVITEAFAASDAVTGEVGGETVVSGMVIDGHPVRIDGDGLHIDGNDADPGMTVVRQQIQAALGRAGVTFAVADPVDIVDGASASRSIGGLIIEFRAETFRDYVRQLPGPLAEQIERNVAMDQSVRLTVAGVAVQAAATEGFGGFDFDDGFGTDVAGGGFSSGPTGTFTPATGTTTTSSERAEFPGDPGTRTDDVAAPASGARPVPEGYGGLPFLLVAGALALAAVASRWLAGAANRAFAAAPATTCPFEGDVET